jgi:hypothetical protein
MKVPVMLAMHIKFYTNARLTLGACVRVYQYLDPKKVNPPSLK